MKIYTAWLTPGNMKKYTDVTQRLAVKRVREDTKARFVNMGYTFVADFEAKTRKDADKIAKGYIIRGLTSGIKQ